MSNTVISTKSNRVPNGIVRTFSALAIVPDAKVLQISADSAKTANVLEELGLRKIDLFMFGLAAIWCTFSVAKIMFQF